MKSEKSRHKMGENRRQDDFQDSMPEVEYTGPDHAPSLKCKDKNSITSNEDSKSDLDNSDSLKPESTHQIEHGEEQDTYCSDSETAKEDSYIDRLVSLVTSILPRRTNSSEPTSSRDHHRPQNMPKNNTEYSSVINILTKEEAKSPIGRKVTALLTELTRITSERNMDQHEYRKRNQCEINDIQRMRQRLEKDKDEFERYYRRKNDLSLKREEDCHVYTHLLVETLRESDFEINKLKLEKNNLCEKIETLNENIEHTEQEKIAMSNSMEAKEQRFNAVVYNLQKNVETLKAGLEDKKEEHKKLMSEFYEYVKQIRATDDNLATIKTKLQAIQAKISNLSMTLKKFLNPNENQVVYFLYNCFSCNHDVLDCFLIEREDGGSGMDYAIISLLVERLITIYITKSIYDVPIYLGSNVNIPYKELSEWEPFKNSKNWSRVLRQQLCTLVANPEIVDELQYKKDELTTNLIQHLSRVFFEIDSKVVERIKTIIDLAAQVSLAMHSQDEPVKRMDIEEGVTKINPCMAAQHGSVDGATTVQLIICPPYIVNEGQNSEAVLLEGKVICMDYLVKPKTPELNVE